MTSENIVFISDSDLTFEYYLKETNHKRRYSAKHRIGRVPEKVLRHIAQGTVSSLAGYSEAEIRRFLFTIRDREDEYPDWANDLAFMLLLAEDNVLKITKDRTASDNRRYYFLIHLLYATYWNTLNPTHPMEFVNIWAVLATYKTPKS